MKERLIMPEYVVVIDKGGLDTVSKTTKHPTYKTKFSEKSALKIALILRALESGFVSDYKNPGHLILQDAKRIKKGLTKEGYSHRQEVEMMKVRAVQHSQNDYLMLRVSMSEKEMKDARSGNPFDGGLSAIFSATHILHGDKDKLHKWISRMQFEKEQGEE